MGYFRAIYHNQEISERAFSLTRETIMLNQGSYTAWFYRRKLLHELGKDLAQEINWLNSVGLIMEKNYQIWHHRRCIFEMWMRSLQTKPSQSTSIGADAQETPIIGTAVSSSPSVEPI